VVVNRGKTQLFCLKILKDAGCLFRRDKSGSDILQNADYAASIQLLCSPEFMRFGLDAARRKKRVASSVPSRSGVVRTKESPGKEDKNRGFAWGKGMLSSGLRLPLVDWR